jgi:hypothetical protein
MHITSLHEKKPIGLWKKSRRPMEKLFIPFAQLESASSSFKFEASSPVEFKFKGEKPSSPIYIRKREAIRKKGMKSKSKPRRINIPLDGSTLSITPL